MTLEEIEDLLNEAITKAVERDAAASDISAALETVKYAFDDDHDLE